MLRKPASETSRVGRSGAKIRHMSAVVEQAAFPSYMQRSYV